MDISDNVYLGELNNGKKNGKGIEEMTFARVKVRYCLSNCRNEDSRTTNMYNALQKTIYFRENKANKRKQRYYYEFPEEDGKRIVRKPAVSIEQMMISNHRRTREIPSIPSLH